MARVSEMEAWYSSRRLWPRKVFRIWGNPGAIGRLPAKQQRPLLFCEAVVLLRTPRKVPAAPGLASSDKPSRQDAAIRLRWMPPHDSLIPTGRDSSPPVNQDSDRKQRGLSVKRIAALTVLIATLGCSTKPQGKPEADAPPPYTIIELDKRSNPALGGLEHRNSRVVLPNPESKEEVEHALRQIYSSHKQDIEGIQPKAQSKRITILLYDSLADAEDYDGYQICHVERSNRDGHSLPEWDDVVIAWNWRYPEHRPTEQQLRVYRDYWHGLKRAQEAAEAPFRDSRGFFTGKPEDQPTIDRRMKAEVVNLVTDLCNANEMTQAEMEQLVAYVWSWRSGEKPTDDRVQERAVYLHENWRN